MKNELSKSLHAAFERLCAGARGEETPGVQGGYVALYEDHCKALIACLAELGDALYEDHCKLGELRDAAIEAEEILGALAKSTPRRHTEGQGVWTFEDDFICAAHARLIAALRGVEVLK